MASGLLKAGVDLDTLFATRVSAKRADVGIRVAGVDISNRYEPIGAGTPIAATGFKAAGTDLASLFRGISAGSHRIVAGQSFPSQANYIGFDNAGTPIGSVTPGTFGGLTILQMADTHYTVLPANNAANGFTFVVVGAVLQNWLTSIQLVGGPTFRTNSGVTQFQNGGPNTIWTWGNGNFAGLANGGTYDFIII